MSDKNEKRQLKRKFISLEDKVEILNRLKDGERISSVGKSFDLNESTIRTLKRNEEKIRKTMADGCPLGAKRTTRNRDIDIVKMERDLMIWLYDCIAKNIPVNGNHIKEKALQIYNHLIEIRGPSADDKKQSKFSASKGWLENLKKRYSLHNIKFQGEQTAYKFKAESPENLDAYKESITLDMCTNLAENLLINPMLTNRSLSTRIMKNKEKVNVTSRVTGKGFKKEKNREDLEELFREEILNEKELMELIDTSSNILVNENMDKESDANFDLSALNKGLELGEQLKTFFIENDLSTVRREKFRKELEKCLAPYRELLLKLHNKTVPKNKNEDT
ncbi:PREDICTED: tigger transposable element-derived protein 1 [Polistes canadensis]|uniref:tigger transposable element-derived protein 1 n=1 Tax=Polistes canadensis TaxID=91411 RepID=UPI000718BBBD|nr:PREDICTED: tigger transposable element-derived protein 1 [Polistes canadensis]